MSKYIKKLNRRIFKRNLKKELKSDIYKYMNFEEFIKDYEYNSSINGSWGTYEIMAYQTKSGNAETIYTN